MKYMLISVVVVILAYVGYLALNNSSLFQVKVEKSVSVTDQWNIYNSSKYGLEISYPTGFIVEENGGICEVRFGSALVSHGNICIRVIDMIRYGIKSLDDISYTNKNAGDVTTLSSKDITNDSGVALREITSVQNPSANDAIVLFLHNNNAYELNWSCWPSKPCFDNATLEKMVQSIKFNN